MVESYKVAEDVFVLAHRLNFNPTRWIAMNAYLVRGAAQPYLVDGGMVPEKENFVAELKKLIDLKDLRWIFLTHDDSDHVGAVHTILQQAPHVKVITTSRTCGRLDMHNPLPANQIYHLAPGEVMDLGDRTLTSVIPPFYDSNSTAGAFDGKLRAAFTADCFGSPVDGPVQLANEVPKEKLLESVLFWGTVEAPWIHGADRQRWKQTLKDFSGLGVEWIFSGHLPPAKGLTEAFCEALVPLPDAAPWYGRTQAANLAAAQAAAAKSA